jgi:glycosyltransferase involved in cell wall biosynthesis
MKGLDRILMVEMDDTRNVTRPTIGVLIAAHNAERFLAETLDSVVQQTLKVDQVLVVDDGSTDATAAIASAWGAEVIRQENGGVSRARNIGIQAMRTTFTAICDADDLWSANKLARQLDALERNPGVDFAFCDYFVFEGGATRYRSIVKDVMKHFDLRDCLYLGEGLYRCPGEVINAVTLRKSFILPSTFFARTEFLRRIGPFVEQFVTEEDVELLLRIACKHDMIYVDEPLMGYRLHPASATGDPRRQRIGLLRLAAYVLANATKYRMECAPYYKEMLPVYLFKAGRIYVSVGDVEFGRWLLMRSFEFRRSTSTLLWLAVAPAFRFASLRGLASRLRRFVLSRS